MNRIVIVFFAVFNIAIVTYYFIHFYHIIKELREELGHEHEHKGGDHLVDGFRKLEKDEPIPRGMHVRINLQTGEREAKWLSGERYEKPGDDKDTSLIIASQDEDLKQSDLDTMKYQHLKEALKNIPSESTPETEEGDVKRKFRSYEELKKDMKDLKMNVKTDSEVLHELMSKFQDIQSQKPVYLYEQIDMINMLKDLEYLLHQVDNAEEFAKENGISTIILPLLTSNSTILRTLSARVLGAAVQNNGKVQVAAFKTGVIPILLRNIAVEKDFEVRSGSIYALSCLVRSFPLAEMKMIDEGGLSVLISLFDETSDDILKLQLKVVAFFSDLIIEKEDAKFTMEEKEKMIQNVTDELPQKEYAQIVEKFKQYNRVELNSKLVEQGWCLKLAQLLVGKCAKKSIFEENNISKMNDEDVDHDVVDKVVSATIPIVKQCQQQFLGESKVQDFLTGLLKYYTKLANEEKDDSFFHDLYNKVDSLCTILNLK